MIFKKKYKKSEWMEGLLLAESTIKSGGKISQRFLGTHLNILNQVIIENSDGITTYLYPKHRDGCHFSLGICDYLNYFEENKEILLKTLDK